MRNKSVFYLLLVGLLSVVLMLTACGNTTEANDGIRTIPHDLVAGSVNCVACHTGGLHPAPADHADLSVELCSEPVCHAPSGGAPPPTAPNIPHTLEGRDDCLMCHEATIPAGHAGFPVEFCAEPACHAPGGTPPTTAPNIPHTLGGRGNCVMCHKVGGAGVGETGGTGIPDTHEGRTSDICQSCHQPEA